MTRRGCILTVGTDNCPFIGSNRVPSSADCCIPPPDPAWIFGQTASTAELDLDSVATALETGIADGSFLALCMSKGFSNFTVITTFLTESLVNDRFFVDGTIHLVGSLAPADFDQFVEPHRNYRFVFKEAVAELLELASSSQVAIDGIFNDTSAVTDTGAAEFRHYRQLANMWTIKIFFRVDLGTVGTFFEHHFQVAPKSARSSVSYLQYLQSSERNTGKACGAGYMGHDCTQRICAYGLSVYSSMFVELDRLHVPGFRQLELSGAEFGGAEHTYSECSDAGECDRQTGECACFSPFNGKACRRIQCPKGCSGHGRCLPSTLVDSGTMYDEDPFTFSTQNWDRYKQHVCACDRGWEGHACARKICPRGDYVMTVLPDHEEELSGCDVQDIAFEGFQAGDAFVLIFENYERDRKMTHPIEYTANASRLADAVKMALEDLPNDLIPSVTTTTVQENTSAVGGGTSSSNATVRVVFSDPHNSGMQLLLECSTTTADTYCQAGMQPMMPPTNGTCSASHVLAESELNENLECGGRGHCDRATGVCVCNMGTYGEACGHTTDYL